ncbi:hypothetical protein D1Z90_14955 [Motilimonas pumila]|uniref:Uncharacterized protein n=1 Tax=Motilimonas pumila TaxID=2303987 RepID=A0A418YC93_9GAMM|nr:hypothetical protein D1Z90_14955 [Motilimonas pumila]
MAFLCPSGRFNAKQDLKIGLGKSANVFQQHKKKGAYKLPLKTIYRKGNGYSKIHVLFIPKLGTTALLAAAIYIVRGAIAL